jgi:hypothetical protein
MRRRFRIRPAIPAREGLCPLTRAAPFPHCVGTTITLAVYDICWFNGAADQPEDYCAHGRVEFRVNETCFVSPEDGDWTVSAAALFLLRTLSHDHTLETPVAEENRLFPCCGHAVWPSDGPEWKFEVLCVGCGDGIEVFVTHQAGYIVLSSDAGTETVCAREWRRAVLGFAEQVLGFYERCSPKVSIDDDHDRRGWALFWQEWDERVAAARAAPGG